MWIITWYGIMRFSKVDILNSPCACTCTLQEVHALQSPECEYQEDNVPWGLHRTVSKYKADAPESEYYHYDKGTVVVQVSCS